MNIMHSDHIRMKFALEMIVMLDVTGEKQSIFQHWPCFHRQGLGITLRTTIGRDWVLIFIPFGTLFCTCFDYW